MRRTKYMRPGATVELSEEACIGDSTGAVYSAFARNSYIARVELEDGRTIIVSLPVGARQGNVEEVVTQAIEAAIAQPSLPAGGAVFL